LHFETLLEPIVLNQNIALLGLGKLEEDEQYTANVKRKYLETEVEVTPELAKKREENTEKLKSINEELKEINKTFYCDLCRKQYKYASEYEVHLDSYEHNHKKVNFKI
jgi:hypothetical protein